MILAPQCQACRAPSWQLAVCPGCQRRVCVVCRTFVRVVAGAQRSAVQAQCSACSAGAATVQVQPLARECGDVR